jgi:hypothetical protein
VKAEQWIQVVVAVVPILVAVVAYRSATKANKITAETADRGKLTDDLQEEVARLRENVASANSETDTLRFRLRTLTEYADRCVSILRAHGIEPPPVPVGSRHPWEGP